MFYECNIYYIYTNISIDNRYGSIIWHHHTLYNICGSKMDNWKVFFIKIYIVSDLKQIIIFYIIHFIKVSIILHSIIIHFEKKMVMKAPHPSRLTTTVGLDKLITR